MTGKNGKRSSHLKDLALLFGVPAVVAILAAAAIYGSQLFVRPSYDFVYYDCYEYECTLDYTIAKDGQLTVKDQPDNKVTMYYYDVKRDAARVISPEDVRSLQFDPLSKSPDGYTLAKETAKNGFLFWSNSGGGWYLKNGLASKKIDVQGYRSYYDDDIKFLGWVK